MKSVLAEIGHIRKNNNLNIDTADNTNRYRIVLNEEDGTKTAYCFAMPIYEHISHTLVEPIFEKEHNRIKLNGTNAKITISDNILIENEQGFCKLDFDMDFNFVDKSNVSCGVDEVFPTINGIAFKTKSDSVSFKILTSKPFEENICNGKCFCLMSQKFRPSITVSSIGMCDSNGNIVAPAMISQQVISPNEYVLTIRSEALVENCGLLFEVNSYENKLFQDTTVESKNPNSNNAFGGTAFIGHTEQFGEQWLYSRVMYNAFYDNLTRKIKKAVLHIPKLSKNNTELSVSTVQYRFCSFGSTWNNKKSAYIPINKISFGENYVSVDLTEILKSTFDSDSIWTKGIIVKPKTRGEDFTVLSTGDSYLFPILFEINYI